MSNDEKCDIKLSKVQGLIYLIAQNFNVKSLWQKFLSEGFYSYWMVHCCSACLYIIGLWIMGKKGNVSENKSNWTKQTQLVCKPLIPEVPKPSVEHA